MRHLVSLYQHVPTPWRVALVSAYLAVLLPVLMFFNVGLTPDSLIFVFLGAALLLGRPAHFVRDWGVFLLVVILWQQTGPVAKWIGFPLHRTEPGLRARRGRGGGLGGAHEQEPGHAGGRGDGDNRIEPQGRRGPVAERRKER